MNTDAKDIDRLIRFYACIFIGFYLFITIQKDILDILGIDQENGLSVDGLITFLVAVIGVRFVYKQIEQKNQEYRIFRLQERAISASINIMQSGVNEGYVARYEDYSARYIVAWKVKRIPSVGRGEKVYHINILFRIVNRKDRMGAVMDDLCNVRNLNRWSYRIAIPLYGKIYGNVAESSDSGFGIGRMNSYEYTCVSHAIQRIQFLDRKTLIKYQNKLRETSLKDANDEYLEDGIFDYSARYSGIT